MKLVTTANSAATPIQPVGKTRRTRSPRRYVTLRRVFLGLTLLLAVSTSVGCFVPIYSARPERRVQQMLYTSENLRALVDEWERFWQLDAPSHLTPIRTHGGVL